MCEEEGERGLNIDKSVKLQSGSTITVLPDALYMRNKMELPME